MRRAAEVESGGETEMVESGVVEEVESGGETEVVEEVESGVVEEVESGGETEMVESGGETEIVESGGETEVVEEVESGGETEVVESGGETEVVEEVESGGETEVVESGGQTEVVEEVESGGQTEVVEEVESGGETEVVESGGETEVVEEVESGGETEVVESGGQTEVVEEVESGGQTEVVESGGETESGTAMALQLRWPFIRKVCSIVAIQLLLAIAVASVAIFARPVAHFFLNSITGLILYIVLIFLPYLRFIPLKYYSVLFSFTVALGFTEGLGCATENRKAILEAVILTTAVVLSLILSTFLAARRGVDFIVLRPLLPAALVVITLFLFIQTMYPLGKSSVMIYGCLASIMYGGYIIYDIDNIIKRLSYDKLIWASFSLYLDIMQLFNSLSTLFTKKL